MSGSARIVQINVSHGGVPKRPVASARVTTMGLQDDVQRNRTRHGGPERALCLFSQERIRSLQDAAHLILPGSIGENHTIEGVDWSRVTPGVCLRVSNGVVSEVTRYTAPCFNIMASFHDRDESRVSQKHHQGDSLLYAWVLCAGLIRAGDPVRLLTRNEVDLLVARP